MKIDHLLTPISLINNNFYINNIYSQGVANSMNSQKLMTLNLVIE